MKLATRLRFSDHALIEGGADAEQRARDELRREQRLRVAMSSGRPELARADLEPAALGALKDTGTGQVYKDVSAAEHDSADTFQAFVVGKDGWPIFLEEIR